MIAGAVPPLFLPEGQPHLNGNDDDESCISPESSVHPSDYDSEDSSSSIDECGFDEDGREASTISISSSLTSQSYSDAAAAAAATSAACNQQNLRSSCPHHHDMAIMPVDEMVVGPDASTSSSSGDDGWKTESESSASGVSSSGENGSEYDEARRKLQSRQTRKIRRNARTATITTTTKEATVVGSNFSQPIDVERLWHLRSVSAASTSLTTRQRLGLDEIDDLSHENAPSVDHRIIGLAQSSGRKAMLQGNHSSAKRGIHAIPQESPLSREEDDVSTIGGRTLMSYRDLVRLVLQQRGTDIEKGHVPGTESQRGKMCVSHRSDVEMFLILVIAASLVSLVVLLALILKSRE
jgi:hypothetical protein